jgi:hypothetical protein
LSLGADGALDLLSRYVPNLQVRKFAVERLHTVDTEELLCYLATLVHDIRYEPTPDPSPLVEFLLDAAVKDLRVRNDLYWTLVVAGGSATYRVGGSKWCRVLTHAPYLPMMILMVLCVFDGDSGSI